MMKTGANPRIPERDIPVRIINNLEKLGLHAKWLASEIPLNVGTHVLQADGRLRLAHRDHAEDFIVEVKRAAHFGALQQLQVYQQATGEPALLMTETLPEKIAMALKEAGIAYADTAGNAWIDCPAFLINIEGRKGKKLRGAVNVQRAFQPTGLKLLFILLCKPELVALPTRELAEIAGVANGTVGWVLKDLEDLGYLQRKPRRQLRLDRKLLDRWVDGYRARLRPRLLAGRYDGGIRNQLDEAIRDVHANACRLGGEAAARTLTRYLEPGTLTFYVQPHKPGGKAVDWEVVNYMALKGRLRKDEDGDTEFLLKFWPDILKGERAGLVPTILVYADLVITGNDRCLETAEILYEKYLDRHFTQR